MVNNIARLMEFGRIAWNPVESNPFHQITSRHESSLFNLSILAFSGVFWRDLR
jgi:hypothetical protein